jgi:glycoside/pentoside/hexuronide:cation symporter, GPH family
MKNLENTLKLDWRYIAGSGGYSILDTVLKLWLIYYLVPPPGRGLTLIEPQMYGLVVLSSRWIEAVAHPLIGHLCDKSRKPKLFLLVGNLLFGICSICAFSIPNAGLKSFNSVLLLIFLPLAFIGQASYIVPYLGLLPAVAPLDVVRTKTTNLQALLIIFGVFLGQVGSGIALRLLNNNIPFTAIIFITLSMAIMLFPLGTVVFSNGSSNESRTSFSNIVSTLSLNKTVRVLVIGQGLFWLGFNLVRSSIIYYITVILSQSESQVALYLGSILVVCVPSLFVVPSLTARYGKRKLMILALLLFTVLMSLLATVGSSIGPLSSRNWALLVIALHGFPLAILSTVPNQMMSDEIEIDGQASGAFFFGLQGMMIRISLGIAGALLGYLLTNFGYSQVHSTGILLVGPIAGLCCFTSAIAYSFYPKNRLSATNV